MTGQQQAGRGKDCRGLQPWLPQTLGQLTVGGEQEGEEGRGGVGRGEERKQSPACVVEQNQRSRATVGQASSQQVLPGGPGSGEPPWPCAGHRGSHLWGVLDIPRLCPSVAGDGFRW